jgi:hypothetical protein
MTAWRDGQRTTAAGPEPLASLAGHASAMPMPAGPELLAL